MNDSFKKTAFEQQLLITIQPLIQKIQQHPLLQSIHTIRHLQRFSEIHVFAVYDFMCLVKGLQQKLLFYKDTSWLPPINALGARLMHEIMMEEESDTVPDFYYLALNQTKSSKFETKYMSHFEWYLKAMTQCGANTQQIQDFIESIRQGLSLSVILQTHDLPKCAVQFMKTTFELIAKPVHVTASSFAYGRESITQSMFTPILNQLTQQSSLNQLDLFKAYFQRHIELDGDKHNQQAQRLVAHLCGEDPHKWQAATAGAVMALNSRLALLDGILEYVTQ